jgi:hypothetical protein
VALLEGGATMPFKEVTVPAASNRSKGKRPGGASAKFGRVITPRLLGGEEVLTQEYADPRQPLMDWLRQDDNPYFARALVNRVWAHYFGAGLVEPPDDMNLANPPTNGPLLDYLSREFVAHGFDLHWLHREILTSNAYQRSWQPTETNAKDERGASRAVLRRLPAEVLYDALVQATASDEEVALLTTSAERIASRAIGASSGYSGARDQKLYAVGIFGRPTREIACDCDRSASPSLQQTLFLKNDEELLALIDREGGWLAQIERQRKTGDAPPMAELITQAWLRTLSRQPTAEELRRAEAHLAAASSPQHGLRDLVWALVNTKEFIVNH